ncbi:MAG: AIPR family protein, partial [Deltaproteobacteria bacterium]
MINLEYPNLLELFPQHLDPKRSESASFLIWYLENYYRLDTLEATDSVCDQNGDKGVDGIYINDADNTIDIFQSRISQKRVSSIGDVPLKEFFGTLSQFNSKESLDNLVKTGGDTQVVRLIKRLDVISKIGTYDIRGIYLCNLDLDANGASYLATVPNISCMEKTKLESSYVSDKRSEPISSPVIFDVAGFSIAEYIVDKDTRAIIVPIKASELATLRGIADQSLFDRNVRGMLGNTKVNRDIVDSIRDKSAHKLFPLFHNGITVICQTMEQTPEKIKIDEYFVVNGCQSLNSIFENKKTLTDNLRVLTKIIKMDVTSNLAERVTRYSNNQNGIKARDFKSNNTIQVRLQNEFSSLYNDRFCLEVKRGENLPKGEVISNEDAGLYFMAFDLKEPWGTHRKYQVFDDKYPEIFGRPDVTADRIVFCHTLMNCIQEAIPKINNHLFGKYALTKFALLYILRLVLEEDEIGKDMIHTPAKYVRNATTQLSLQACLKSIINDIIIDVNGEVDALGDDFDYHNYLRDSKSVQTLARAVVGNHLKLVQRGRIQPLSVEWGN